MMKSANRSLRSCWLAIGGVALSVAWSVIAAAQSPASIGRIERLSDQLDQYVDPEAPIEVLAGGFTWTEGPVWVSQPASGPSSAAPTSIQTPASGFLLFSDIPRNAIYQWSPAKADGPDRGISLFMQPSGYTGVSYYGLEPGSNGLTLDLTGRLTMCEHGDRRVSQLTPGGGKITLADRYQGKRLNSPNDAVIDSSGNLYFTDPPYGLPERADDVRRELDFCGVYRLDLDGELVLLTDQMTRPNGIGLSPDESTLYVAQSDPDKPIWMAFPIQDDGALGEGRELGDATKFMEEAPGLPDGLAVHSDGTLFASGPGGIYVMLPDGTLIGRLFTGGRTSNCTFDDTEQTLYITADDKLCRVQLKP